MPRPSSAGVASRRTGLSRPRSNSDVSLKYPPEGVPQQSTFFGVGDAHASQQCCASTSLRLAKEPQQGSLRRKPASKFQLNIAKGHRKEEVKGWTFLPAVGARQTQEPPLLNQEEQCTPLDRQALPSKESIVQPHEVTGRELLETSNASDGTVALQTKESVAEPHQVTGHELAGTFHASNGTMAPISEESTVEPLQELSSRCEPSPTLFHSSNSSDFRKLSKELQSSFEIASLALDKSLETANEFLAKEIDFLPDERDVQTMEKVRKQCLLQNQGMGSEVAVIAEKRWSSEVVVTAKKRWSKLRQVSMSVTDLRKCEVKRMSGRRRSTMLLDSLFELRRLDQKSCDNNGGPDSPSAQLPKSGQAEGEEGSLLLHTLGDTADTPEDLRQRAKTLQESQEAVEDYGGMRHATSCIFQRAMQCMLRKAGLLENLLQEQAVFEAACEPKAEVIQAIMDGGSAKDVGQNLARFHPLLKKIVHDGPPQDADKSCWVTFVQTFGLPLKHMCVLQGRRVLKSAREAWVTEISISATEIFEKAKTVYKPGKDEHSKSLANSLLELASLLKSMGVKSDHPTVEELMKLEKQLLAWIVLQIAHAEVQKDATVAALREQAGSFLGPGNAAEAALRIDKEIQKAVAHGLSTSNVQLAEAIGLAEKLRDLDKKRELRALEEEGIRKRMENAKKREAARLERLAAEQHA